MPQPSCICTVLLKLAKVERLKIPKFWVHVLFILKGWQAAINCVCKSPTILGSNDDYTIHSLCKPISTC